MESEWFPFIYGTPRTLDHIIHIFEEMKRKKKHAWILIKCNSRRNIDGSRHFRVSLDEIKLKKMSPKII